MPLKTTPRTFHGREIDFIALRVPMLRHAVNASALVVPITTAYELAIQHADIGGQGADSEAMSEMDK